MIKVVCVDTYKTNELTMYKIYDADKIDNVSLIIINDNGNQLEYSKHRFEKLSDFRNKVINKILEND